MIADAAFLPDHFLFVPVDPPFDSGNRSGFDHVSTRDRPIVFLRSPAVGPAEGLHSGTANRR
ncbi:hypothetical protein [Plantactinospora endophytica]|uniref:hypothetical protein n=1 Tax=Plantactinospora endophytica TaxID=673535 RepID=UPI0019439965|nr:hypothetical protein [Plantactinospora endophytica]